jgi:twitching motility protein PilT
VGRLDDLLGTVAVRGGSDLHLASGREPRIRVHGHLEPVEGRSRLDDATLRALMAQITTPERWAAFGRTHDLDFAYELKGVGRFRVNFFEQQDGAGAVFRRIPERVVPLEDLGAPPGIERLAHLEAGLVLVTGPTGSGKSTTLAAIVDRINATYAKHIVTIEDPIEFVHSNRKSIVSQREVGTDTASFAAALRSAIRQDASVVMVGEMRDLETILLALTAAEMGLLVFATLHTNSAAKTIDRVVDAFPAEQQAQARSMLGESLAAVVAQLLLRTADGKGRCAAHEILLRTPGLPNVIRESNTPMLASIMQSGRKDGMQTMDDALFALAKAGRIDVEDAALRATDKRRFEELRGAGPA